ncbi:MAG: hypothetical protein KatS3mg115_0106 [Candidatus Poribacteria bacterium]|nr:MAG: hypothetical protein KatS3mg115_0106 [Candidatus Poribacteria bacterium]
MSEHDAPSTPRRNRLAEATSPYLLQHADNPVDWYPWCEEALERARREDKPILLSIGYAACHWCHVMEKESFENPEIARIMNEHFVCIKVDREERPDLDALYMMAVQAMTGHGGWPLTVFLTPDLVPFFGGTYFPPEDRQGMPGFPRVLRAVAEYYATQREELRERAAQIAEVLRGAAEMQPADRLPGLEALDRAFQQFRARYDVRYGGFGSAPKFPQPTALEFLSVVAVHRPDSDALEMLLNTLDHMARGGIYDQLGGGFHRYSTDERWLVPHFEKMLYDNALLPPVYLAAYRLTGEERWATVARETLDYLLREMRDPAGGFYSSQDADSEGEEGKYYVWSRAEIEAALGEAAGPFCAYYGVREGGNWEPGKNILFVAHPLEEVAAAEGMSPEALTELLRQGRERLLQLRAQRTPPETDDKVLTAWNGLALSAFAQAAGVLGETRYLQAAQEAAAFLLEKMFQNGKLLRSYRRGVAHIPGFLEDYAYLANGLLDLFEADQDPRWLSAARQLAERMVQLFWDESAGGFFSAEATHRVPLTRLKEAHDGATPSGNAIATRVLLRLYHLFGEEETLRRVEAVLRLFAEPMAQHGTAYPEMLLNLADYLDPAPEIVLVAARSDAQAKRAFREVWRRYLPGRTLVWISEDISSHPLAGSPLVQGKRSLDGQATFYLCRRFTCSSPTGSVEELLHQLGD